MRLRAFIMAICVLCTISAQGAERPNIVLYVTDDQGMDDAGCYGNPAVRTPGLDALAAEGTRFTNAFCTTASCSASRSVILTGLHNHANGMYGLAHSYHHFDSFDSVKSLPMILSDAGYRTLNAGKYHVAPAENYRFDAHHPVRPPVEMAEKCQDFIDDDSAPFFLYFCTQEPHRPFRHKGFTPPDPADVIVPDYLPDTPECREELALYYASLEAADAGLARLMEMLKANGQWENTVVLYVSDNGIAFPGAKTTLYEPGMRLPCVVRKPGQTPAVNEAMVSWADITPTLLEAAGVAVDTKAFQGRSFWPILEEASPDGWDEVYASHTFHEVTMYYPMRVVRTRDYKLIWNIANGLEYPFASDLWNSTTWQAVLRDKPVRYGPRTVDAFLHRPRYELYKVSEDPLEGTNLADDPDYGDVLTVLQGKMRAFQEQTKDPWLLKWERE